MIGGGAGIVDAQGVFFLYTHWLLWLLAVAGSSAFGLKLIHSRALRPTGNSDFEKPEDADSIVCNCIYRNVPDLSGVPCNRYI